MSGLIVHEWAERSGGAEQVVEEFLRTFPDADLQVLWNDAAERFPYARETWLGRTPLRRHKALALPLMPATWRHLDNSRNYDWILVSSHLFAHHARLRGSKQPPKLVYAHTPARYLWDPTLDERGRSTLVRAAGLLLKPLDRSRSQEALDVAANSNFTRDRIERAWQRDARVIYPPVDVDRIIAVENWADRLQPRDASVLEALPPTYLLGASRFVSYKRLDQVILAGQAAKLPVVIAGRGPDERRLRTLAESASVKVSFVIAPSDELLMALYQNALAFIFPAVEDFGIMPVEAMASGTPVVVSTTGGAAESVGLVGGGVAVEAWTGASFRSALDDAAGLDRLDMRARSQRFSNARFRSEIEEWVGNYA